MEKLSDQQVILAMLEITQKEASLLTIQTVDIVQALQQNRFQQALNQYEPLLERVRFLGGMLLRVNNTSGRLN
jgi:polyphosphate kinase